MAYSKLNPDYETRFKLNRQRRIIFTVFKSFQKSQTHYQKEERFTVQNKMTNAGPHQRKYSKSTAFHLTQTLLCHEERSTLQNKKTRLMTKIVRYLGLHDMKWKRPGWDQNVRSSNRSHDLSKVCVIASLDGQVLIAQDNANKPS